MKRKKMKRRQKKNCKLKLLLKRKLREKPKKASNLLSSKIFRPLPLSTSLQITLLH